MQNINDFLELPKSCYIHTKMPKKVFTDNPEFNLKKEEKTILKEEIESIYFEYSLKPALLNIPKYEDEIVRYEEIEILKVRINNENKYNKVCELLQKYIQYPIIIIIENKNYIRINAAIKKINKIDSNKLIVDEMIYTDWININNISNKEKLFFKSLSIYRLNNNNMLNVYEGYLNCIRSLIVAKYKKLFEVKTIEETLQENSIINKICELENQIQVLKNQIKKETNISRKIELNIKINTFKKEIQSIKEKIYI